MSAVTIIGGGRMSAAIATVAARAGARTQVVRRSTASASDDRADVEYACVGDAFVGDVVVLAVPAGAYASILERHREDLAGRVVVDISNPIDFSTYEPVSWPEGSAAADLAVRLGPDTPVVKAFNTTFGDTLVRGTQGGEPTTVLLAGDDALATSAVATLVEASGLRAVRVGPLTRAHELEAMGYLQIVLAALGRTHPETGFTLLP